MADAGVVPEEALAWFLEKDLKPSWSYLEVWREEHALAFTVAKITEMQALGKIRDILTDHIKNGGTLPQFEKQATGILEAAGWMPHAKEFRGVTARLRTIYETNITQAHAAGQWDRIERTKEHIPYLLYEVGPSAHHRDEHLSWHGTLLRADDPWWNTHFPMNGYGCKCTVRQVGNYEFEKKRGGKLILPKDFGSEVFVHPDTLESFIVPVGIDPGFEYNPGKARDIALQRYAREVEAGIF